MFNAVDRNSIGKYILLTQTMLARQSGQVSHLIIANPSQSMNTRQKISMKAEKEKEKQEKKINNLIHCQIGFKVSFSINQIKGR